MPSHDWRLVQRLAMMTGLLEQFPFKCSNRQFLAEMKCQPKCNWVYDYIDPSCVVIVVRGVRLVAPILNNDEMNMGQGNRRR